MPGGLEAETHAIFRQMNTYLEHLGLGFGDVVKCLVMIDDIAQWGDFNGVYTQYSRRPTQQEAPWGLMAWHWVPHSSLNALRRGPEGYSARKISRPLSTSTSLRMSLERLSSSS